MANRGYLRDALFPELDVHVNPGLFEYLDNDEGPGGVVGGVRLESDSATVANPISNNNNNNRTNASNNNDNDTATFAHTPDLQLTHAAAAADQDRRSGLRLKFNQEQVVEFLYPDPDLYPPRS